MTQYEKLLAKFLENPKSLRFSDIEKILKKNGFNYREAKGSHCVYTKGDFSITFAIHNNDCKKIYKKKALKIFSEMQEKENQEEEN